MNGFEVTHPWNRTDDTVLLVYNTSMDTKIFTFGLPGQCARERERDVKIQFQFQPQQAAETRPHKSDIFNYFIPFRVNTQQQSGPELSTPMN